MRHTDRPVVCPRVLSSLVDVPYVWLSAGALADMIQSLFNFGTYPKPIDFISA